MDRDGFGFNDGIGRLQQARKRRSACQPRPTRPTRHPADELDQAERTIELQAQRAKHDIDQATADAEKALEDARHNLSSTARQHTDQLKQHAADLTGKAKQKAAEMQELTAELAEDAKDRAEDIPDAVDQEVTRQLDRFKLPKRHPNVEEEPADESNDSK